MTGLANAQPTGTRVRASTRGPAGDTAAGPPIDVTEHLDLVRKVAWRIARRLPSNIVVEELVSVGVLGLLEAAHRYSEIPGKSFRSHAEFRIKGAIYDELRRRDPNSRYSRQRLREVELAVQALRDEYGRDPELREIAQRVQISEKELERRLQTAVPVRLVSFDSGRTGAADHCQRTPQDLAERAEIVERVKSGLERLKEKQRIALDLYYRQELTLAEVGRVLGVSESRACQLVNEATVRLRTLVGLDSDDCERSQQPRTVQGARRV